MGYKRPESILVLMYREDGRVLVMQRSDDPEFWQSVTGSLKDNESPYQAALREVREETGVDVSGAGLDLQDWQTEVRFVIPAIWRQRYAPGVTHNREHWFGLQLPNDTEIRLSPHEHLAFLWLSAADARAKMSSWSNRAALDRLFNTES